MRVMICCPVHAEMRRLGVHSNWQAGQTRVLSERQCRHDFSGGTRARRACTHRICGHAFFLTVCIDVLLVVTSFCAKHVTQGGGYMSGIIGQSPSPHHSPSPSKPPSPSPGPPNPPGPPGCKSSAQPGRISGGDYRSFDTVGGYEDCRQQCCKVG